MPISLNFTRPALATTVANTEDIDFSTPTIVGDAIEMRVYLDNLTIDNTVVPAAVGISWVGTAITGTAGDFSDVRVGDVISSATGWVSSQLVTAVAVDGSSVTASAIADVDTNNEILTFTPGDIDSSLYFIRLNHSISGSSVVVTPTISCLDGTLVADGAVDDGDDEVTYGDGAVKTLNSFTINLDPYLTNARVARV